MMQNRKNKMEQNLQKHLGEELNKYAKMHFPKHLVSIIQAVISPDFGYAKIYISIFPDTNREEVYKQIVGQTPQFRKFMAKEITNHLRKTPEISFHLDFSMEESAKLDEILKGKTDNPLKS